MSTTTTTPECPNVRALATQQFPRDVEEHKVHVLRDDGLYRHLRCRRAESNLFWFDLITWPGHLAMTGDMGEWLFARDRDLDMVEFFTADTIDPSYWAEKCRAKGGDIRRYDPDAARKVVSDVVDEWVDQLDDPEAAERLRATVAERVLTEAYDEVELRAALDEFGAEIVDSDARSDPTRFTFHDTWELDLTDYTYRFWWACHAIRWGVATYRTQVGR